MDMTATSASGLASPALRFPDDAPHTLDIADLRKYFDVTCRKVGAGRYLYHAGQPFRALHLVHSGVLKTSELSEDGREQVTGFRMEGDLLGAESIGLKTHVCEAFALEDSEIWDLPYPAVLNLCREIPELQIRLTTALAEEIRRNRSWMLTIGTLPAEQRVAMFLLDIARRSAQLGLSAQHLKLRMGREDIANFLALTHETVSRALSQLQRQNYISVLRREVKLLDIPRLQACVGMC